MYFCGDCKKQFQGGRRIDSTTLWQSYLTEKRTVKELSVMHKCSERTIRRKLKLVAESFNPSFPKEATVIIDTTYFSRTFGVMLFQDATSGKILYPKSVIRISLCRTAKRNPLIFSIWTRMIVVFLVIWPNIGYACLLFSPGRLALIAIRTELSSEISSCWN